VGKVGKSGFLEASGQAAGDCASAAPTAAALVMKPARSERPEKRRISSLASSFVLPCLRAMSRIARLTILDTEWAVSRSAAI
jgi:hypothetical protein